MSPIRSMRVAEQPQARRLRQQKLVLGGVIAGQRYLLLLGKVGARLSWRAGEEGRVGNDHGATSASKLSSNCSQLRPACAQSCLASGWGYSSTNTMRRHPVLSSSLTQLTQGIV